MQWAQGLNRFYWYAYDNPRFGTLYSKRTLTPAGIAYLQVSKWMIGATQAEPCAEDSSATWTCGLTRPGGYQALAVWNAAKGIRYRPTSQFKTYRDMTGASHSIFGPLPIGDAPVLLETDATPCGG
jgi:hypothetical protein